MNKHEKHVKYSLRGISGSFPLDERLCRLEERIYSKNADYIDFGYPRAKNQKIDDSRIDDLRLKEMIDQAISWTKIAEAFSVSQTYIIGRATRLGYKKDAYSSMTKEQEDEMVSLREQGLTWKQIASMISVPFHSMYHKARILKLTGRSK